MSDARIVFVGIEGTQILDVTGPLEVFSTATRFAGVRYRTEVVSARGGPLVASCGIELSTKPMASVRGPIDTLVVAGGTGAVDDPELLHQVRRLARSSRRVASVCTGALVLARAGLLDGRRVTTHWAWCARLAERHPDVTVEPDSIYVRDGDVWTSAGVTSGIDLALALVADDHDQHTAATVARHLVVYLQRGGGQAQYSAPLAAQDTDCEPLVELLTWMTDNLDADLTVSALARRMHLSERQFARVFKAETGLTPAAHVESIRLDSACRLLETTALPADHIARVSGFGTPETMHRTFRRRLGTTPGEHRRHFCGT